MGRTMLSPQRLAAIQRTNLGHIIIFCEGKTEKYYFDYFAKIIKKNKYTNIEIVFETANGNAQGVLNLANHFFLEENNIRKFSNYEKCLAFDCDDPPDIQQVVGASKDYKLLISNPFFETWLLMHFEEVDTKLSKRKTYQHLSEHLNNSYSKGHKGKIREIIGNGNVEKAIDNAKSLERQYESIGKSIEINIIEMNPYTSLHTLIEQFMFEISSS